MGTDLNRDKVRNARPGEFQLGDDMIRLQVPSGKMCPETKQILLEDKDLQVKQLVNTKIDKSKAKIIIMMRLHLQITTYLNFYLWDPVL